MRFSVVTVLLIACTTFALVSVAYGEQAEKQLYDQALDIAEKEVPGLVLSEPALGAKFDTPEKLKAFVKENLGPSAEWTWDSSPANLIVIRKAGSWYQPSALESPYDDLFLVVFRDRVVSFAHGNCEGTIDRFYVEYFGYTKYKDPTVGKTMTPALGPGCYRFKVGYHSDYKALRVTNMRFERLGLPSQRLNGKFGKYQVGGVNIHKGGSTWNWSIGCLTLHYTSFSKFIDHFVMNKWGRLYVVGDWDGEARAPSKPKETTRRPVKRWNEHQRKALGE